VKAAALALVAAAVGPAVAAPLTVALGPGVAVDWGRGVITARGFGPADRNAPSPAVARVAAERAAIARARVALAAAVAAVPGWRTLGLDPAAPAMAREIAAAPVLALERGTDGSVTATVGLGVEAVRQAAAGPRVIVGDDGPPVVVAIDVRALAPAVVPAVGLELIGAGGARWRGPIRFAHGPPAGVAAEPATGAVGARLMIAGAVPGAGATVVVVVRPEP
jgi:hypothetical protein